METTSLQYPVLIYKSKKNNTFVANCIIKNMIGFGDSEKAALSNLNNMLNKPDADYPVILKPVYRFLPEIL